MLNPTAPSPALPQIRDLEDGVNSDNTSLPKISDLWEGCGGGRSDGFGLIEVIISIVVISVGLLGFATLQQKSMTSLRKSDNTGTAAVLALAMANKITANKEEARKGSSSAYIKSYSSINPDLNSFSTASGENSSDTNYLNSNLANAKACFTAAGCSSDKQAVADIWEWKAAALKSLPNGRTRICFDQNLTSTSLNCDNNLVIQDDTASYVIKIMWDSAAGATETYVTTVSSYMKPPKAQSIPTPNDAAGTQNEQYISAIITDGIVTDTGLTVDPGATSKIIKIRGINGLEWNVNGTIKLGQMRMNLDQPSVGATYQPVMIRDVNSSSGYTNNAGDASALMVKDNFVAFVVGCVNRWPASGGNNWYGTGYSGNGITFMEFGYKSAIQAFTERNGTHMLVFSAGGTDTFKFISTNSIFHGGATKDDKARPFIALYRKSGSQFTAFTADQRDNIRNHGTSSGSGNAEGPGVFSIGGFSNFNEPPYNNPAIAIGEARYIDKSYTDQQVLELMTAVMQKWGFPWNY